MSKTVTLPISDCECFIAGEIDNFYPPLIDPPTLAQGKAPPKYGVIIWYENKETAKAAAIAVTSAHWNEGETNAC